MFYIQNNDRCLCTHPLLPRAHQSLPSGSNRVPLFTAQALSICGQNTCIIFIGNDAYVHAHNLIATTGYLVAEAHFELALSSHQVAKIHHHDHE